MGFNWCSSNVDIVEPRFLELSHIKHLMPERVHNFMLALYPCLLSLKNNDSFTVYEVLHYDKNSIIVTHQEMII